MLTNGSKFMLVQAVSETGYEAEWRSWHVANVQLGSECDAKENENEIVEETWTSRHPIEADEGRDNLGKVSWMEGAWPATSHWPLPVQTDPDSGARYNHNKAMRRRGDEMVCKERKKD